jgi:hypothetical protein
MGRHDLYCFCPKLFSGEEDEKEREQVIGF